MDIIDERAPMEKQTDHQQAGAEASDRPTTVAGRLRAQAERRRKRIDALKNKLDKDEAAYKELEKAAKAAEQRQARWLRNAAQKAFAIYMYKRYFTNPESDRLKKIELEFLHSKLSSKDYDWISEDTVKLAIKVIKGEIDMIDRKVTKKG